MSGRLDIIKNRLKGDSPIFADHRFAAVPAKIGTVPIFASWTGALGIGDRFHLCEAPRGLLHGKGVLSPSFNPVGNRH
jgi:hypothetical protein